MKKIILSAIFFLLCISAFAQKIQFTDPSNVWSLQDSTIGCCVLTPTKYTTAYYDTGTFSYKGHTYLYLINPILNVLVRDSASKVYVLGATDSIERVLYDFTLTVGDTLRTSYPQDLYTVWVTAIDSTQLSGAWYKVWHFTGVDSVWYFPDSSNPVSYNVIEGIGSTNGVYYPGYPYYRCAFFEHLLCFKNSTYATPPLSVPVASFGYGYIGDYFDNDSSCAQFDTVHGIHQQTNSGVQQINSNTQLVTVIPNPTTETGRLVFSPPIASGQVIVLNSIGQQIINLQFENKDEALIGDKIKVPGVYFYRVTNNETGKVCSGKFVRQ